MMPLKTLLLICSLWIAGCSSAVVRTQSNDPMMRVLIDPRIPVEHYVHIRRGLVQSGKFEVIDRRDGFEAALREQDLQFRSGYQDRFSDREKWAHIGRMYGARGIITAHASCYQKKNWLGEFRRYCKQDLTFIDSYTGRVEFAVTGENSEPWTVEHTVPDWDEVIDKAVVSYPRFFKAREVDPMLKNYMEQSEELSKRERDDRSPRRPSSPSIHDDVNDMREKALKGQEE